MLSKLKPQTKKSTSGFTIIEVMIVLAIAGLILLIVFLAVPALQRSARNTQRKNDVSAVLAAVSNSISNNNGQVPAAITTNGASDVQICSATPCSSGNTEDAKLGYYTPSSITLTTTVPTAWSSVTSTTAIIVVGYTCPSTQGTLPTASNVNSRDAVALYALENGSGGDTNECQEQ